MLFFPSRAAPELLNIPSPDLASTCAPLSPIPENLSQASTDTALSQSSWDFLTPPTSQGRSSSPLNRNISTTHLSDCSFFDGTTFGEKSHLLPAKRNGDFRTSVAEAVKHPVTAARTARAALDPRQIAKGIAKAAEAASESIHDKLTHALHGKDLPAMHDRVMNMIPSVFMPTARQVSRSVDAFSDNIAGLAARGRVDAVFLDEELAGDRFAFAQILSAKAKKALVSNGICQPHQIMRMGAAIQWQQRLDDALIQLFTAETKSFTVGQLFNMKPIWVADAIGKVWRLELETGFVDIVMEAKSNDFEEKSVTLDVGFSLPEGCGSVRISDVERMAVVADEEWMAVEEIRLE